jgi:hypothetical protein
MYCSSEIIKYAMKHDINLLAKNSDYKTPYEVLLDSKEQLRINKLCQEERNKKIELLNYN